MTSIAVFFSEWEGNLLICLVIMASFLLPLEAYFRHTRHIARQLRIANALLEPSQGALLDDPVQTRLRFVQNWSQFRAGIEAAEMKIFASPWAEFTKNLHLPRQNTHAPIRSLAEPVLYFNENSLFHSHVDTRLYDAVPGYLARGGILGTFIGLVSGIYLVQGGFSAGEEEMKLALGQLMGGASTAFDASIVGISLSVLFSVFEKRRRYQTVRLVRRFSELLEGVLEVSPPENSALIKIHEIQVAQLAEMQKQSAQSKSSTASQINAIANILNTSIGKLTEALVQQKTDRSQSEQMGMQHLSEQLRDENKSHMTDLQYSLWQQHEVLVTTLKGLMESNLVVSQNVMQQVGHSVRESFVDTGSKLSSQLHESSGLFTVALERILSGLDETRSAMQGIHHEMQRNGELNQGAALQVGKSIRDSFEETNNKLSSHMNQSSGLITVALERMLSGMDETRLAMQGIQQEMQQQFITMQRGVDSSQGAVHQVGKTIRDSLEDTNAKLASHLQQSFGVLTSSLERILAGLEQTRLAMQGIHHDMQRNVESSHGAVSQVGKSIRDSLDETNTRLVSHLRESSGVLTVSLERILAGLDQAYSAIQGNHQETQRLLIATQQILTTTNNLLRTFDSRDTQSREEIDRRLVGFGELLASLNANLQGQNTVLASAWNDHRELTRRDITSVMNGMRESLDNTGGEMATKLLNVVSEFSAPLRTAGTELSDVAARLNTVQETMSAQVQTLVSTLGGKMDRFVTGLSESSAEKSANLENVVALAKRFDQAITVLTENAGQLQRSDASRDGSLQTLSKILSDFRESLRADAAVSSRLLTAVGGLERSVNDLGNHLTRALEQLAAGNLEMFSGLHRTADQTAVTVGQLVTAFDRQETKAEILRADSPQEGLLQAFSQFIADFRESLRTDSAVSSRLLVAVGSMERATSELGNRMTSALEKLATGNAAVSADVTTSADRVFTEVGTRVGEIVSALHVAQQELHNLLRNIPQIVQQPLGHIEANSAALHRMVEQMESVNLAAFKMFNDGHQTAQALQNSQQQLGLGNVEMQEIIRRSGTTFYQAAESLNLAAERVIQAFNSSSTQMSETTRMGADGISNFTATFDHAQHRFMQMIDAMESGAAMIALAGEKFQSGAHQLENVASSLIGVQETASKTLGSITTAHEQLRTIWHNYNARSSQVDSSLEQTFVHLNNGLTEFANHTITFIAGLDDHTGAISEKLGSVVGEFGSKLDDLNDTMSDFLDGMSGKLISPMQTTSLQISQAGDKIQNSLHHLERLTANVDELGVSNQDVIAAITATPDQIKSTVELMHQQMAASWGTYHAAMQQTVSSLNSEVREFSSERVLEFVGGVDEHMEQLSTQLRDLLHSFNKRLDVLNESMDLFVQNLVKSKG